MSPAEQAALVHGMERVDEHLGAIQRKSSRDASLAESEHDVGFGRAGQARLGQPFRQFGEGGFVHMGIIQTDGRKAALGMILRRLAIVGRNRFIAP